MTYETIKELFCRGRLENARKLNKRTDQEMFDKVIAALEKQIPKKPNKKELTEQQIASRMFMLAEHYFCICGHPVVIGQPACDKCCQRLDWGE